MEGPGISLFQGSDSIKLSNDLQRQEEEEFLEEEKIRKAELKNLFENAFDDLIDDDDESTVTSSHYSASDHSESRFHALDNEKYNKKLESENVRRHREVEYERNRVIYQEPQQIIRFQNEVNASSSGGTDVSSHYQHCFRKSPGVPVQNEATDTEAFKEADSDSLEQLKVLYDVRLREIDRLNQQLLAEREEKDNIIHRLAVAEAENEGMLQSYNQGQQLLVASKEKLADLENEVITYKNDILNLEKNKEDSIKDLEIARNQIRNLKQTMSAMERCDATINREKQMDDLLKTIQLKHQKELAAMQHQLDSALSRYNQKDSDCNTLEKKLEEMEKKHSAMLLNKCDSMVRQESTLQALLDEANREKLLLNKKVSALQAECNMLKTDLEQYESVSRFRLLGNSSSDELETDSMIFLGMNKGPQQRAADTRKSPGTGSTPQTDILAKLKDELHRALVGQRVKRNEIRKLQEQIQSKELQIHEMKEKERSYLSEVENLKSDMAKILEQFRKEGFKQDNNSGEQESLILKLKSEIDSLKVEREMNIGKIKDLEAQIKKLNEELEREISVKKKITNEYLNFHDSEITKTQHHSQEMLKQKELEWGSQIETLIKESNKIKEMYIELQDRNEKLSKILEEERQKKGAISNENETIKLALSQKEKETDELQKLVNELKQEKNPEEQVKQVSELSSVQAKIISTLEAEIKRLHNELSELPRRQTIELEGLKAELEAAKKRLIELEKELRLEFENEKMKIMLENDQLKDSIIKKENEISMLKFQHSASPAPDRIDVAVMTETFYDPVIEKIDTSDNRSELEVRLRAVEDNYKKQKDCELKELEKTLAQRHRVEIAAVEERVKNVTVAYFSEEIKKLSVKHSTDVHALCERHQKIIEELKKSLSAKQIELEQSKQMSTEELKQKLLAIKSEFDAERNKAAELMAQWAREVQNMKKDLENKNKEINGLKGAVRSLKKSKRDYKLKFTNEKSRVAEYKLILSNILTQCNNIMVNGATELGNAIRRVEQDYLDKEKELKENLERKSKT